MFSALDYVHGGSIADTKYIQQPQLAASWRFYRRNEYYEAGYHNEPQMPSSSKGI